MVGNKEQFGYEGLDVQGITIHNTGNTYSAQEVYDLVEHSSTSQGMHFLVDENEVLEFMPLDWCVYHTGMANDWACQHTIAIEICRSQCQEEIYMQAQKRAIKLIKKLLKKYKLTTDDIYYHNDFKNNEYCPHRILEKYASKQDFIRGCF